MAQLTHRFATPRDAAVLAQMNRHLIDDEGHTNPMTLIELSARMAHWLEDREYAGLLFHAAGAVSPAGYALYRDEGGYVYIRHFFVARDQRRRGIGSEMMRLLRTEILPRKRITLEVLVRNEAARAFYRSVGFQDYAVVMDMR